MNHQRLALLGAAAVLALASGCASEGHMGMGHGTSMGASAAPAAGSLSSADMTFVVTAAGTDMYEIQASQLAMTRAATPAVRNYAQMLVNHHTMSTNELQAILAAKGVTPPASLPADKQVRMARLSGLQGGAFDREYIRMTGVQDHQTAIGIFQQASQSLPDRDLRGFAAKTLPVLQQHLRSAQDIAGGMAG